MIESTLSDLFESLYPNFGRLVGLSVQNTSEMSRLIELRFDREISVSFVSSSIALPG